MNPTRVCSRSTKLCQLKKYISGANCVRNICDVFGTVIVKKRTCQNGLKNFAGGF